MAMRVYFLPAVSPPVNSILRQAVGDSPSSVRIARGRPPAAGPSSPVRFVRPSRAESRRLAAWESRAVGGVTVPVAAVPSQVASYPVAVASYQEVAHLVPSLAVAVPLVRTSVPPPVPTAFL